jgi:hypothetical protein
MRSSHVTSGFEAYYWPIAAMARSSKLALDQNTAGAGFVWYCRFVSQMLSIFIAKKFIYVSFVIRCTYLGLVDDILTEKRQYCVRSSFIAHSMSRNFFVSHTVPCQ